MEPVSAVSRSRWRPERSGARRHEGGDTGRADAIETTKRLFIAATGDPRSIRSAVATVLFDNAVRALDPEDGLMREELGYWVNDLLREWQKGTASDELINTALLRLGRKLPEFIEAQLPYLGVTKVEGPTRNQRSDSVERVWLAVTYTPPADDSPGLVGRTIEEGLRSSGGDDRLADYQRALAAGASPTIYEAHETHGHSSSRKRLLILAVTFPLVAGGLLAHPTTRKWIMLGLGKADAWIMPSPTPPPTRPHGTQTATPAYTPPRDVILPGIGPDVQTIASVGSRAYIATGRRGLLVVDLANKGAKLLAAYPMTLARDVAVVGDVAYVAAGGAGVFVLDVRDPAHIRRMDMLDPIRSTLPSGAPTGGAARSVTVQGSTLAVAEVIGCSFYDITDPAAPRRLGEYIEPNGIVLDVVLSGATAILACGMRGGFGGSLRTVDVTDPQHPQLLATLATDNEASKLFVRDRMAYVANQAGGLWTVDVSEPRNPSTVDRWSQAIVSTIAVNDNRALVTTQNGAAMFDFGDRLHPKFVESIAGAARGIGFVGTRACTVVGVDFHCESYSPVPQETPPAGRAR